MPRSEIRFVRTGVGALAAVLASACATDADRLVAFEVSSEVNMPASSRDAGGTTQSSLPPDASGTGTQVEVDDAADSPDAGGPRVRVEVEDAAAGPSDAGFVDASTPTDVEGLPACPTSALTGRYEWEPLDWSGLSVSELSGEFKIFDADHPSCETALEVCQLAESDRFLQVPVQVYLDSDIWSTRAQLENYLELVNRYFMQAALRFEFDFDSGLEVPTLEENIDQVSLIFARAMTSPAGSDTARAFGNMLLGKAVVNDSTMTRTQNSDNPYFLPGKTIGFVLGLVLGASIVDGPDQLLMAQGYGEANGLDLLPEQALIVRSIALDRFGATPDPPNLCP